MSLHITRTRVLEKFREELPYALESEQRHRFYDPQGEMWPPQTRQQITRETARKAWLDVVPDYGWPGGYAIEYIDPAGDVLCGGCARAFLKLNRALGLYASSTDGYEGDDADDHLLCDECGGTIAEAWDRK